MLVFTHKPIGFKAKFEVVSCFVEFAGKILLLLRQDSKPQPNTWGVPAGKKIENEGRLHAVIREIAEETGFQPLFGGPRFHATFYVRYPEHDFVYHIFHFDLPKQIDVRINPEEHKEFKWIEPREALALDLIPGLDQCIRIFYRF